VTLGNIAQKKHTQVEKIKTMLSSPNVFVIIKIVQHVGFKNDHSIHIIITYTIEMTFSYCIDYVAFQIKINY